MSKKQLDSGAGLNMCLYFSPFMFPFHFWLASSPFIPSRGESQRDKVTSGPAREKLRHAISRSFCHSISIRRILIAISRVKDSFVNLTRSLNILRGKAEGNRFEVWRKTKSDSTFWKEKLDLRRETLTSMMRLDVRAFTYCRPRTDHLLIESQSRYPSLLKYSLEIF